MPLAIPVHALRRWRLALGVVQFAAPERCRTDGRWIWVALMATGGELFWIHEVRLLGPGPIRLLSIFT
jgi:uncharacterized membrane protein